VVTGVLRTCKAGWCVDKTALDFGADADMSTRVGDLNADGRTRSLQRELRALEGLTMTVVMVVPREPATDDPAASAGTATGSTDSDGTGSADAGDSSAGTPPAADPTPEPTPVLAQAKPVTSADPATVITVDADGIVVTINGITCAVPAAPTS